MTNQFDEMDRFATVSGPLDDEYWMQKALAMAKQAGKQGEVPVGAIVVMNGQCVAESFNQPIASCDATAHAEIIALRAACSAVANYRLTGATLYVTIEPCTMCFGAMLHARIKRLVYGAAEPRAGVVSSQLQLPGRDFYNHKIDYSSGVLADECGQLMADFFKQRR
ncbi:MAG: tRNA adenosine(34) deaminase TadA [Pseudomonadales bacterium]|nr:tRNA adenosine(34) deaminase TadA [Pseudomonadales bacterium]